MPTYASTADFDLSIDEIAEEAYERCGLQVRSGYDLKTARRSLNLMLSEWANRGLPLHNKNKPTDTIHTYNRNWSKWITNKQLTKTW